MNYKVLSLFSGAAGLDVGFSEQLVVHKKSVDDEFIDCESSTEDFVNLKRLPFTTVFQNDILPSAKEIAEWNGWAHNYVLGDIHTLLEDNYDFPKADVVTGGFPCQDFSHSGKRKGLQTTRGTLYQSFVEVVKRVKPTMFVAENVNGLLTMPGEPIKQIISDFSDVGYDVKYQLIKSETIGIPQTRWRVIIMGIQNEKNKNLPENWNRITKNQRECRIGSYFKHLKEPTETEDPAQTVYSKAARLEKGQGQKEVGMDEFAPTMRAEHHGNIEFRRIHGGKNNEDHLPQRRLSVREAALIQTFPPDSILTNITKKPTMKAYKPIGNAVPPLLGYLVADKVYDILSGTFICPPNEATQ
jgi:DNA (cytosine-5)-methyltransferase 1|tara:strand:- start:806 stop:1873 length:1068 start_codon:yes stop_codon:yes gene_type:complete